MKIAGETTMMSKAGKFILLFSLAATAFAAGATLRAGASRVDITPAPAELTAPYKTIYQPLYVRTIILESGDSRAAMVVADVPMIQADIFNDLVQQIAREAACPPENVMLAATHTHSSIRVATNNEGANILGSATFVVKVREATVQSVREARANLQPAKAGFGRGNAYFTRNRNTWSDKDQRYVIGTDRSGDEPIDNTVAVLKFERADGSPIAVFVNYSIEPVVSGGGSGTEINGDLPGATAKYIEEKYAGKTVLAFTVGAAGNPAYSGGGRRVTPGRVVPPAGHEILSAMSTILGEEIITVLSEIQNPSGDVSIGGAQKVLTCPGKDTTPMNLPRSCAYTPDSKLPPCRDYKDKDIGPVDVRLSLLRIGDTALVQADTNITPALGLRLTQKSPLKQTVFVALNFGPARFVVEDSLYPLYTYDSTASRLKPGCGERGLLNGAAEMIGQTK